MSKPCGEDPSYADPIVQTVTRLGYDVEAAMRMIVWDAVTLVALDVELNGQGRKP